VFRNFLLSEMHSHAKAAAEVAEFAGRHSKFWEMHDKMYENQERLGEVLYLDLAEKLKLSTTSLRQALEQRTFEARVRADFKGGARSGVNGTPTFFINGQRHDGSFDFETLVSAIQQAVGTAKKGVNAVLDRRRFRPHLIYRQREAPHESTGRAD
jgi:protein-disulfide isomerase